MEFIDRFLWTPPNIIFEGNPSSGKRGDTWRRAGGRRADMTKVKDAFRDCANVLEKQLWRSVMYVRQHDGKTRHPLDHELREIPHLAFS